MLFESDRHETLHSAVWDQSLARQIINQIYEDTKSSFSGEKLWPIHPLDGAEDSPPLKMLYFGATGVIWALQYLERVGAVETSAPDFSAIWTRILEANRAAVSKYQLGIQSLWMGDAGILLVQWLGNPTAPTEALLKEAISLNRENPALDFMWGAPGTMLAALEMFDRTGNQQYADLFCESASSLWSMLDRENQLGCPVWTQDIYGTRSKYVGMGHGFAGNIFPVIRGRKLLNEAKWINWCDAIVETMFATAVREDGYTNWLSRIDKPISQKAKTAVQYCHGAPGIVICLADFPDDSIGPLLLGAGELIWTAGPLTKGAGLCHGTGGNGYAFLKLFQRTQDQIWLERARAFAMHAINQYEDHRKEYGRGRYSLWTGDQGLAIYLWSCIQAKADFPTMDFF